MFFHFARTPLLSAGFVRFRKFLDPKQLSRPKLLKRSHPTLINLPDRHHVQRVESLPSRLARVHQLSLAQYFEMFNHSEPAQVRKFFYNLGSGARTISQEIQNGAPGRIRERLPYFVEFVRAASDFSHA